MQDELPLPQDDGAARHLAGASMPDIGLSARQECRRGIGLAGGSPEISARPRENLTEHLRRQHAGVRIIARAVITVEKRDISQHVPATVTEGKSCALATQSDDGGLMGDASKRNQR